MRTQATTPPTSDNFASIDIDMADDSPVPSDRASPRIVSEDRRNRVYHSFRSLVSDIAERLNDSDIQNIIWQQDVSPSSLQNNVTALEVLEYLYKHGVYTEREVRPLAQLLKDIHREDLTSRVDTFWKQFGRHFSNIDSMRSHNARKITKDGRSTLSGTNPLNVVIPEIPAIVTTTQAAQESQESNAAGLPDDHKHYLINSSPSTQSIVSIPSEPPQLTNPVNATKRHHHSENKTFCTGSSVSLHPPVSRVFSEPATNFKKNLSASCSWLEVPSQRCSPQWCNSPPGPSSSNMSQVSEHNSDILEPTASHYAQHPSSISPPATLLHHDRHFQRPPSLKSLPALMNNQHSNTSPPNSNCMTMHSSVSQEYSHAPHIRLTSGGHGHCLTYVSQGNPSHACMLRYSLMPEVVPQSSYSETDMLHLSTCNCIQNQCPHCGTSMAQQVHMPCIPGPVAYTHNSETVDQLQTHPFNQPIMRSSDSVEISNSRAKRAPESNASGEGGSKLSSKKPLSAIQRKENQNPAESDSESELWSSTNADHKPNQVLFSDEDEGSHNKPANSMKPPESSIGKSEKEVSEQRPHSATTNSGNAATTTTLKLNLHSSADTLAENHCTTSRTTYAPPSALASKTKPSWKRVFFHAKPKVLLPEPNQVIWPIKQDKLNKYIYKHTSKLKTCKEKLELVPNRDDCGPLPKFTLQLHPYGSEEDSNRYITAKVTIDFPKKCHLHSKTKIEFQVSAREDNSSTGKEIGHKQTQQEQITQNFFYIKEFITHEELKESQCNYIYVTAEAKLA